MALGSAGYWKKLGHMRARCDDEMHQFCFCFLLMASSLLSFLRGRSPTITARHITHHTLTRTDIYTLRNSSSALTNKQGALARSLAHALAHSLTHSLTRVLARSLTHSLTRSLTHSLAHSLTRSLTHSLTRSLTHSLAHSPTD